MPYRKKLIEVALPLEAINVESAREKSIRQGHPSTLHLWWARRPLAACRAVLWSSLVDDPSEYMPNEESANLERERLFAILEKLVLWENIKNEEVLDIARLEIARSVARDLGIDVPIGKEAVLEFLATKAPPVLDPFSGGGSIPLEAQRLGLRANATDLNPVAVLINKALIEIPPKYAALPPIHPPELPSADLKGKNSSGQDTLFKRVWKGTDGLVEDVRYYGKWMSDYAEKRIGHLYPKVKITAEMLIKREDLRKQGLKPGEEMTVIAWLWARTVKCPNPACGVKMPLTRSFTLSTKKGQELYIQPKRKDNKSVDLLYELVSGKGNDTGTVNRGGGKCIICNTPVPFDYIRLEGKAKRMNPSLIAIICEGPNGKCYFSADSQDLRFIENIVPAWVPEIEMPYNPFSVRPPLYGFKNFADIFTNRQLNVLNTFSELLGEVVAEAKKQITNLGNEYQGYDIALATYLSFAISRGVNYWSTLTPWGGDFIVQTFGRQALPMIWDFAEGNPFSDSTGNWMGAIEWITRCLDKSIPAIGFGSAKQANAMASRVTEIPYLISTDPPYYNNVDYADLSDYFYVWLRHSLSSIYPTLFSTMLVPKTEELVATPYRFDGGKEEAKDFFEAGLLKAFSNIREMQQPRYPVSIYYAFKQAESDNSEDGNGGTVSTGWETMLEGLIKSGFMVIGTWPLRTERDQGLKSKMNVLASSILLVCRRQENNTGNITRRDFLSCLKKELSVSLRALQQGNIAPVDLAQTAIGPGMAIYSRYQSVLEADGTNMHVRAALALINHALDEYLAEQEGEYDGDTRWALAWFEQFGHEQGPYGVAETLSKAKNTSVEGLSHAGFLEARGGKVRLLQRDELDESWDPTKDKRLTAWESAQYLIRALDIEGEKGAGILLGKLGSLGETARDLAYRLYTICERKGWAQEALAYNMLVVAWPRIKEQSGKGPRQESLL